VFAYLYLDLILDESWVEPLMSEATYRPSNSLGVTTLGSMSLECGMPTGTRTKVMTIAYLAGRTKNGHVILRSAFALRLFVKEFAGLQLVAACDCLRYSYYFAVLSEE